MTPPDRPHPLILASTSKYRAQALSRLGLAFVQIAPGVEENEIPDEAAEARAVRLSLEKARAVARLHPGRWVLGSDQVAASELGILHKPGSAPANIEQLLSLSGREARFHSGIALVCDQTELSALDTTVVRFRQLDRVSIERYVAIEPAHDCAGGFKVEGLGISLFEAVHSSDPTGLVGLPLIALCRLLRESGLTVP